MNRYTIFPLRIHVKKKNRAVGTNKANTEAFLFNNVKPLHKLNFAPTGIDLRFSNTLVTFCGINNVTRNTLVHILIFIIFKILMLRIIIVMFC